MSNQNRIDRKCGPWKVAKGSPWWILAADRIVSGPLSLPWMLDNRFYLRLATEILIYGLLAMSLDVLLGYTGLLSFMHAVYMGIAAYTVALYLEICGPGRLPLAPDAFGGRGHGADRPPHWLAAGSHRRIRLCLADHCFRHDALHYCLESAEYHGGDDGLIGIPSPDIGFAGLTLGSCRDPDHDLFLHPDSGDRLFLPYLADHAFPFRRRPGIYPGE